MIVSNKTELDGLAHIGEIVAQTLVEMRKHLQPGITTKELDEIGGRYLAQHQANSAPNKVYNFPGFTCISVNEAAAHGVPSDYMIQPGDVVNIDVSAEKNGLFADTGFTFCVEPVAQPMLHLVHATRQALAEAITVAKAGALVSDIGKAIETRAKKSGYKTLRDLASHGIGRSLHEYPETIPNYFDKRDKRKLEEGMVITIEPFLSTHSNHTQTLSDGWTLVGKKGNRSAQFEHTMMITQTTPKILTSSEIW